MQVFLMILLLLSIGGIAAYQRGIPIPYISTPPPEPKKDTGRAVLAMRLAVEYMSPYIADISQIINSPGAAAHALTVLSLAANKVREAEKYDPDARIDTEDGPVTVKLLKSNLLYFEAQCRFDTEPRRAQAVIEQAITIAPHNPALYRLLGLLHESKKRKAEAVAAYQKAVALSPDDISLHKLLDHASHMPTLEILLYRYRAFTSNPLYVLLSIAGSILFLSVFFRVLTFITSPFR